MPVPGDRALLEAIDRTMADAATRAGPALACRLGCTACCIGPFAITALDALRLQAGLRALRAVAPERAQAVVARAKAAVAQMRAEFPGDAATGILDEDEAAEERFARRFVALPCPALDPATGGCELYAHRPLTCRTFGPPLWIGTEPVPPCHQCFVDAPAAAVERCRVAPDPDDQEGRLLRQLPAGETVVAWALAAPDAPA